MSHKKPKRIRLEGQREMVSVDQPLVISRKAAEIMAAEAVEDLVQGAVDEALGIETHAHEFR